MIVTRTLGVLAAALSCAAATAVPAVADGSYKIVGGSAAPAGSWPSIAYLRGDYQDDKGDEHEYACTGSVVAPEWIVTAAHCTMGEHGEVPSHMEVTLGVTDSMYPAGEKIAVDRFVPDPSYDSEDVRNDVGLLHLAQPTARPPMPLATSAGVAAGAYSSPSGVPNAAGWGAVDEDGKQIPSQLQEAYLEVRQDSECSSLITSFDSDTETCAGTPGATTACFGDSGGPLTEIDGASGKPVLWGVTSYRPETGGESPACSVDEPTVYTRIPAYSDFIKSTIAKPPAESGSAPASNATPAPAAAGFGRAAPRARTAACRRARAVAATARRHERTALRRLRGARRTARRHRAVAGSGTKRARRRYRAARAHRKRATATAARRCR